MAIVNHPPAGKIRPLRGNTDVSNFMKLFPPYYRIVANLVLVRAISDGPCDHSHFITPTVTIYFCVHELLANKFKIEPSYHLIRMCWSEFARFPPKVRFGEFFGVHEANLLEHFGPEFTSQKNRTSNTQQIAGRCR